VQSALNNAGVLTDRWRLLRGTRNKLGYISINIRKRFIDGSRATLMKPVHQMVLETFVGPRPEGMVCRHLDGNPSNNRLENLRWGTVQENMADMDRHGRRPPSSGELNPNAILTKSDIPLIRQAVERGESRADVAKRFGVSRPAIDRIVRKETWTHV
jgi:hypothetical protein